MPNRGQCIDIKYAAAGAGTLSSLGYIQSASFDPASGTATNTISGLYGKRRVVGGVAYPSGDFSTAFITDDTSSTDVITDFFGGYCRAGETGFPCGVVSPFDLKIYFENETITVSNAIVTNWAISGAIGGPLMLNVSWIAENFTEGVAAVPTEVLGAHFDGTTAVASLNSQEYTIQDFTISGDNASEVYNGMDTKVDGSKRKPLGAFFNSETITVSFNSLEKVPDTVLKLAGDILADDLVFSVTCENEEGATFAATISSLSATAAPVSLPVSGLVNYSHNLTCNSLAYDNVDVTVTPAGP